MGFSQRNVNYVPKSKKQKADLRRRIAEEKRAKKERQEWMRNTKEYEPKYQIPSYRTSHSNIPSGPSVKPKISEQGISDVPDDMIEREKKAKEISDRRKKCMAPAYNKGAYQPVLSKDDAKWIGRS